MPNSSGETLAELVYRHEKDLYRGNGLPGLCTRMKVVEDDVEATNLRCDKSDERQEKTQRMFWAVILLLLTIFGTQLASFFKPDPKPPTAMHSYNE